LERLAVLREGYRGFRERYYPEHRELFTRLTEMGQAPKAMIVSCCDSRVDPTVIFSAQPGDLFVVRNVANQVPPCESGGRYHGTSAALEFAVLGLGIPHVVVLGHAQCGGVAAFLDRMHRSDARDDGAAPDGGFIDQWMSLLEPAWTRVRRTRPEAEGAALQRALEQASVVHALDNLKSFPFVRERMAHGALSVHGGYFDIPTAELSVFDPAHDAFVPLASDDD